MKKSKILIISVFDRVFFNEPQGHACISYFSNGDEACHFQVVTRACIGGGSTSFYCCQYYFPY